MSGDLEQVFSQVVMACSIAALAAIAMREGTSDRALHLCARLLGGSAWLAIIALSYFTIQEYRQLEQVIIVRQSTKVVEPALLTTTEMELPSGITIAWSSHNSGRHFTLPNLFGPDGRSWPANRSSRSDSCPGGCGVQGVRGSAISLPAGDGSAASF